MWPTSAAARVPSRSLCAGRCLRLDRVPRGPAFAAPLGVAFALGWTPCVGPVLAGLLAAAAASSTVAIGAGLLAVYAAGLALPFLGLAWAVTRGRNRAGGGVGLLGRHHRLLARVGGPLLRWFARSGWPPI